MNDSLAESCDDELKVEAEGDVGLSKVLPP